MTVLTLFAGLLMAPAPAPSPACPFLDERDARRALGGEVALEVADFDSALEGASSCRFSRVGPGAAAGAGRLVIAELGVASASADPFASLRPKELAVLEVPTAPWSVLLPAAAVTDAEGWYRGLAGSEPPGREAVVLLWSDEDGFETAVLLDAPGRSAEVLHSELTRLARHVARTQ
jgi:hypothetical protein